MGHWSGLILFQCIDHHSGVGNHWVERVSKLRRTIISANRMTPLSSLPRSCLSSSRPHDRDRSNGTHIAFASGEGVPAGRGRLRSVSRQPQPHQAGVIKLQRGRVKEGTKSRRKIEFIQSGSERDEGERANIIRTKEARRVTTAKKICDGDCCLPPLYHPSSKDWCADDKRPTGSYATSFRGIGCLPLSQMFTRHHLVSN